MNKSMKKVLFYVIVVILSYIVLEIAAYGLYFIITGERFPFSHSPQATFEPEDITSYRKTELEEQSIHPYIGYVCNPTRFKEGYISNLGFASPGQSSLQVKREDSVVVGIFGGSVAAGFSRYGHTALAGELKKMPQLQEKKILVLNFGQGGYKQPQQLMTLNYMLALGAHFDIVINIDGFNEIVLPVVENIPQKVFPFFPKAWHKWVPKQSIDHIEIEIISKIFSLRKKRERLASLFSKTALRYSAFATILRRSLDIKLYRSLYRRRLELLQHQKARAYTYAATGPPYTYKTNADIYKDIAEVWKNCSIQMHNICQANKIKYFHILQPCQYVPNSKIMGEKELRRAYAKDHIYRQPVITGYPVLSELGKDLESAGVSFADLTMVFKDYREPLYIDTCYHFNRKGYEIIGTAIGEMIAESY